MWKKRLKGFPQNLLFSPAKVTSKRSLTRWGVEPQRIVVAGVPLKAEDMLLLNPNIPESALEPIKKKISHVKNDINRKME